MDRANIMKSVLLSIVTTAIVFFCISCNPTDPISPNTPTAPSSSETPNTPTGEEKPDTKVTITETIEADVYFVTLNVSVNFAQKCRLNIEYSTDANLSGSKVFISEWAEGRFTCKLPELNCNTTYYYRYTIEELSGAYILDDTIRRFNTLDFIVVKTSDAKDITEHYATLGGNYFFREKPDGYYCSVSYRIGKTVEDLNTIGESDGIDVYYLSLEEDNTYENLIFGLDPGTLYYYQFVVILYNYQTEEIIKLGDIKSFTTEGNKANKSLESLQTDIERFIDRNDDIYTYHDDAHNPKDFTGPRVLYRYLGPREVNSSPTEPTSFTLIDASSTFFYGSSPRLSIIPTYEDSLTVFYTIRDYFRKVAEQNEASVPYLKFIAFEGVGYYKVDSIRADNLKFSGMKMKKSNVYLDGLGIKWNSLYDNKGITNIDDMLPSSAGYYDALTNLIDLFLRYIGKYKDIKDREKQEAKEAIELAQKNIERYFDIQENTYTYQDSTHNPIIFTGPRVLYKYLGPRDIKSSPSDANFFIMKDATKYFFNSNESSPRVTISPTREDSLMVINAISNFFKNVADIDGNNVPYLKFVWTTDYGGTYQIDKVRADDIDFNGFITRFRSGNWMRVSVYDNKGVHDPSNRQPQVAYYYDSFSNYIDLYLHFVGKGKLNEYLYDKDDEQYSIGKL